MKETYARFTAPVIPATIDQLMKAWENRDRILLNQ
jgi:hypothetical protein